MAVRSICAEARLFGSKSRASAVQDFLKPVFGSSRSMTTEDIVSVPTKALPTIIRTIPPEPPAPIPFAIRRAPTVLATTYVFPTMEPMQFKHFPSTFLYAPLRKDILHKAIVFEGDAHRLGRGSAKTRAEVRGSTRKIRPQKGTGRARLGDKKSPMLRGGGVAHGPRPRDFSSDLPKKVYDMAWRTALSYRYRRGELVIVANMLDISAADSGLASTILKKYGWGNEGSRSLLVTAKRRENIEEAMKTMGSEGRVLTANEVDVKDLLEMGRVVIEIEALLQFQTEHGLPEPSE